MKRERIQWVDICKGIGILLVIIGHCVNSKGFIFRWIFTFHMPLFFILSGLFFSADKMTVVIRKKFKQLIIPYLSFCFIGFCVSLIIPAWRRFSIETILREFYQGNPNALRVSSVWFLNCLFVTVIVFNAIVLVSKTRFKLIGYILFIGIVVFGFYLSKNRKILKSFPTGRMPFDSDCACVAILFFAAGFLFRDKIINAAKFFLTRNIIWRLCGVLLSCVAVTLIARTNGTVNLHAIVYHNPFLYISGAVTGFAFVFFLGLCWQNIGIINQAFTWLGKNSLKLMGTQAIVLRLYHLGLYKVTGRSIGLYSLPLPYSVYGCVIVSLFSIIFVFIYNLCKNSIYKLSMAR